MGRNDPYSPRYDPRYQGEDGRDVAFAVDNGKLYLAGVEHFPVTAGIYANASRDLYYVEGLLRSIASTAGRAQLDEVADHALTMFDVLALTSRRLYAAGDALVGIAADFVGTDVDVETEMDRLVKDNREVLVDPTPRPQPPVVGSPWSLAPVGPYLPGQVPDGIPTDAEVDQFLEGLDLDDDLEEHEREQAELEEGLPG